MNGKIRIALGAAVAAVCANGYGQALPAHQTDNPYFTEGAATIAAKLARADAGDPATAKNVILFVGDGMGVSTLTASRILEGQLEGRPGEEGYLSFETFPYTALVKTYNVDAQTPIPPAR